MEVGRFGDDVGAQFIAPNRHQPKKSPSHAGGAMARQEDSPVMLSTFATLSVNSAKHLEAHGILDLCLRLMGIIRIYVLICDRIYVTHVQKPTYY